MSDPLAPILDNPPHASHRGIKTHRYADNPTEKRFADEWVKRHASGRGAGLLAYLMGDGNRPAAVSARDEDVAATVVQWLGSPVGRNFLRDCGFVEAPDAD